MIWLALSPFILIFLMVVVVGTIFRLEQKRPGPDKPFDLTTLDKRDYDFLRANGLEVDQSVHDHFYPPVRKSKWDGMFESPGPKTERTVVSHRVIFGDGMEIRYDDLLGAIIVAKDARAVSVPVSNNVLQSDFLMNMAIKHGMRALEDYDS